MASKENDPNYVPLSVAWMFLVFGAFAALGLISFFQWGLTGHSCKHQECRDPHDICVVRRPDGQDWVCLPYDASYTAYLKGDKP